MTHKMCRYGCVCVKQIGLSTYCQKEKEEDPSHKLTNIIPCLSVALFVDQNQPNAVLMR